MRLVTKGNWRHVEKPIFYVHVSPSTTLKDSFATLDFNQFEVDTNEEDGGRNCHRGDRWGIGRCLPSKPNWGGSHRSARTIATISI